MTDHAARAARRVKTTPTVPESQARTPLPPVKAGSPPLTDADLQAADQLRPTLSRREVQVLRGIATGWTRSALARYLGISEGTVKTYLERIRRKYDDVGRPAPSQIQLYHRAFEDGYLGGAEIIARLSDATDQSQLRNVCRCSCHRDHD
jgi:DNA-binding CsgD family transcriptional regulator